MALTRAQLLMGDINNGAILSGQPQGVRPGGNGITIRSDGVIEVNSQTIVGVMKLGQTAGSAAAAFNGYTWPTGPGLAGQQLETDGTGNLTWADSDGIDWTQKGQLIVGTGVGTDILFNVGSNRSFIVADSSTPSGLNYTDAIQTSVIIPSGQQTQRPSGPVAGDFRLNTDTGKLEFYTGGGWEEIASGDPTVNGFVKQTIPTAGNPSAVIPTGTTAQRQTAPAPADGYLRFNTTTGQLEVWDTSAWEGIPSSATGTFVQQTIPTTGTASAVIPPGPTGSEQSVPAPAGGYMRYNTTQNYLEFFNGSTWELVAPSGGSVHSFVQSATPTAFNTGDIWYNPTLQRESVWDGSAWVQPGVTQTSPTGAALIPAGTPGQQPAAASVIGGIRYNSTGSYLEFSNGTTWVGVSGGVPDLGLNLDTTNSLLKAKTPEASAPPTAGTGAGQAILGSTYYDNNLGGLFVYYSNGGTPVWVQV